MNEIAEKYRATAKFLNAEADLLDPPASANMWNKPTPVTWPLPAGLVTDKNPYGVSDEHGSPGFQVTLRTYARRDGVANRNKYVTDRGLVPIWPDEDQPWEANNL